MKRYDMWDAFAKTGRVDDYLRYCGREVSSLPAMQCKRGGEDRLRNDDRCADHQGKQQYR